MHTPAPHRAPTRSRPRSLRRCASLVAASSLVLLAAAPARAQDELVEPVAGVETAERSTWIVRDPPPAFVALGGLVGPLARGEDVLVIQAGPREDARLVIVVDGAGKRGRQTLDLRAESIVVVADVRGSAGGTPRLRAVYAEGFVRLVVEAAQGQVVLDAEQAWLDLEAERSALKDVEVRVEGAGAGPRTIGAGGGKLDPRRSALLFRAERLRTAGARRIVGENVVVAPSDHGRPLFALGAERLEATVEREPGDPPPPPLLGPLVGDRTRAAGKGGSDALRGELGRARWIEAEGLSMLLVPPYRDGRAIEVPFLPWARWRSDWPLPRVRFGRSSRFGVFGVVELRSALPDLRLPFSDTRLVLEGRGRVEHYERRGTGGELGLTWKAKDASGREVGEGQAAAFGIRDRAREDRVGTPIEHEGRFWLRAAQQERPDERVRVDAEVSRVSDRGVLLEYYRRVAQTDKEQETYVNLRTWDDSLSVRALARVRLNDFQTQVERLPEVRLDAILVPLADLGPAGQLSVDVAARAGWLRLRYDDTTLQRDLEVGRADVDARLVHDVSLGPLELRSWIGGRETGWTARDEDEGSIDRFAGTAGWTVSTVLWRTFSTPWGPLRHEVVPEVGTRHVFAVNRDPWELRRIDEVEHVRPTDQLALRLRTRLVRDEDGRRRKLLDLQVESRMFLRGRGGDDERAWAPLAYDLRLEPTSWLSLRMRGEQDVNRGELLAFDASATWRIEGRLAAQVSFRELPGLARAVGWAVDLQLTPAWSLGVGQQYDLGTREFLFHRGRVVRRFDSIAVAVDVSHDPQQDDTSVSAAVVLVPEGDSDLAFERDRWAELYPH